jgi:hypothetical protein
MNEDGLTIDMERPETEAPYTAYPWPNSSQWNTKKMDVIKNNFNHKFQRQNPSMLMGDLLVFPSVMRSSCQNICMPDDPDQG